MNTVFAARWLLFVWPALTGQLPPPPGGDHAGEARPQLVVVERKIDLGTVLEGDKVPVEWSLRNEGQADLLIDKVNPSCGCTVVKLSHEDKTLPPGKQLRLKAEFNSKGRRGRQDKGVTVLSNDPLVPSMKLEFTALVEALYNAKPSSNLNLRSVQRGESAARTLEVFPVKGRKLVSIKDVEFEDGLPVSWEAAAYDAKYGMGSRVHFTVDSSAGLGTLSGQVKILLEVDGIERTLEMPVRAQVVGELVTDPVVLDTTRHRAGPGKKLPKVTVEAMNKRPFKILQASAGPFLDVQYEAVGTPRPESAYEFQITVGDEAPAGPFGVFLEVQTDSLDQPVIHVPVYGIIVGPVEVDPPMIMLRQDGTPMGTTRLVRLQARTHYPLQIQSIECDSNYITARIDEEDGRSQTHLLFLRVELTGRPPAGKHETVLRLKTNVEGAESLEIPVMIEAPAG